MNTLTHGNDHGGHVGTAGMPLLLDSAMGIDGDMHVNAMDSAMALDDVDLFGDPVMDTTLDNPLNLPSRPEPNKQLQQRLQELRTRGCCQGIAWSRQGTIASVTKDGRAIDLRFLRSRPDNGAWELSESYSCSNTLSSPVGIISHLAWGATSSPELAVIDTVGRISILSFSITLNRCYAVRKWDLDPVDDLHAVVGCYWLPLALQPTRPFNVFYGPAVWEETKYRYETSPVLGWGPWHPNPAKSALVCVTTNGLLKLIYSQHNNRVEETVLELESVTSSDDLITHASLCSDRNTLLIALATASKQLRVVRATLQWGLPQQADKQAPPGSMPLSPSMKEKHVAVTSWLQHGPNEPALDTSMAQLSHIEMLPPAFVRLPNNTQHVHPPLVLTVRSYLPPDSSPYSQDPQSVIDRWEILSDHPQTVHPAFEQLGAKNGSVSVAPPTMARLRKLESIAVPKIIVSISMLQLGKVICFTFSDGTVQYRDRLTMNEVYNEHNVNSIMSLHQVGFQFTNDTPCLQSVFSPTGCSFAQICEDGEVKWNKMHYPMEEFNVAMQGNRHGAVLAALTVAIAAASQNNCDDVLAIARPFAENPDFMYAWLRQMMTALKIPVDYSEDAHHDQLVRNHNLQLCLSILNHLGFRGEFQPRSFGSKFAMLGLNVRNIVILITIASNMPNTLKEKLSPLDEPEVVDTLAGCAKWAVDLLSWLADCLFQLADDPTFMAILSDQKRFPELANYLQSRGDVSLHLLLCSSTRGFLSAACRRLFHLETLSRRANNFYEKTAQTQKDSDPAAAAARPTSALYHAYQKMQRFTSSSLVKVNMFEELVNQLGKDIRAAYRDSLSGLVNNFKPPPSNNPQQAQQLLQTADEQMIKKAQQHCELDMLLASNPPPSFREVIHKFFTTSIAAFRDQTDSARLYFSNFDLLEVEDDPKSLARRRAAGQYVDVFRRAEMYASSNGEISQPPMVGVGDYRVNGLMTLSRNLQPGGAGQTNAAGNEAGAAGAGSGSAQLLGHTAAYSSAVPGWRRCVRCASVMEDVFGHRMPGFTFVLAQQRKCSCGGNWGVVLKSDVHP
ncbi:mediator complex subunit 16-domain-containing protein [Apodospora peruviana]|uniref:Mediator of RNA polymerase II transcription subunit 16 n=1 Tax=Apodospora peruviana TaxID=516989 RepID=A0AAE0IRZ7_9PEZI|nr:mediator complex subunit 16-domain-containing protein [Apodospora peruviana]